MSDKDSKRIKINVLGISYSQTQTGAYALILSEENGKRRIPVMIGGFEAQAIAIELEGLKPPRPLTHDLLKNFAKRFNVDIREVNIYKFEEGIFYSELICNNGKEDVKIDTRTSDAVALALRFKCDIFTTEEIMTKAGIHINVEKDGNEEPVKKGRKKDSGGTPDSPEDKPKKAAGNYEDFKLEELKEMMNKAIADEDYEKASEIRDEINRRTDD